MADKLEVILFPPDTTPRKILFLGDPKVGKTTFIEAFCQSFMRNHVRSEFYNDGNLAFTEYFLYREYSGRRDAFRFLDIPSGSTDASREDQYPNLVNLVVVCFAIDNWKSFFNVWEKWVLEFQQYYSRPPPHYLLGLKTDLREELLAEDEDEAVTAERAQLMHEIRGFSGEYMDCSVQADEGRAGFFMETLMNDTYKYEPAIVL